MSISGCGIIMEPKYHHALAFVRFLEHIAEQSGFFYLLKFWCVYNFQTYTFPLRTWSPSAGVTFSHLHPCKVCCICSSSVRVKAHCIHAGISGCKFSCVANRCWLSASPCWPDAERQSNTLPVISFTYHPVWNFTAAINSDAQIFFFFLHVYFKRKII